MAKILIVGCGDIGSRVGESLHKIGHSVWGLKRNPPHESSIANEINDNGIRYLKCDLNSAADVKLIPTDFDQVLYIVTPNGRDAIAYQNIFEEAVDLLLAHFNKNHSSASFIFVSSTRVYAQQQGEWVDEESETIPRDPQGRSLLYAEKQFLAQSKRNTVVRFTGIYGRGSNHLLNQAKSADGVQFLPPYYTNRIHYLDCVDFLCYLIQKKCNADTDFAGIYLATDDDPAPKWDVICWLCEQFNLPQPTPISTQAATQNKRCSNQKMKSIGYKLKVKSFREGYIN